MADANTADAALGALSLNARDSSFTLRCDALAFDQHGGGNCLMLASVAGPHTSVKAFRASLSTGNSRYRPHVDGISQHLELRRWPEGYTLQNHRLGLNTWHLVAIARRDGLIPQLNDVSLWRQLRSPQFSTPLLRGWLSWLKQELLDRELLRPLQSFQCAAAVLSATSDQLDQILKDRAPLPMTEEHQLVRL